MVFGGKEKVELVDVEAEVLWQQFGIIGPKIAVDDCRIATVPGAPVMETYLKHSRKEREHEEARQGA